MSKQKKFKFGIKIDDDSKTVIGYAFTFNPECEKEILERSLDRMYKNIKENIILELYG